MGSQEFLNICKAKVAEYYNQKKDKTDAAPAMIVNDVYVVWYSKTLQNHKALLSTPVSDGMYYELTYNGDKNELYFDAYKKWENICLPLLPPADILPRKSWTFLRRLKERKYTLTGIASPFGTLSTTRFCGRSRCISSKERANFPTIRLCGRWTRLSLGQARAKTIRHSMFRRYKT